MARFTKARLQALARSRKVPPGIKKWAAKKLKSRRAHSSTPKPRKRRVRRASTQRVSAKRKRKTTKRRSTMARTGKTGKIIAMGVGGALSGTASQLISGIFPGLGVTDEIAAGVVGMGLDFYGKGLAKNVGQGMMVGAVSAFAGQALAGVLPGIGGGGRGAGNTGFTTP